jgi:hypothetical protein
MLQIRIQDPNLTIITKNFNQEIYHPAISNSNRLNLQIILDKDLLIKIKTKQLNQLMPRLSNLTLIIDLKNSQEDLIIKAIKAVTTIILARTNLMLQVSQIINNKGILQIKISKDLNSIIIIVVTNTAKTTLIIIKGTITIKIKTLIIINSLIIKEATISTKDSNNRLGKDLSLQRNRNRREKDKT